MYVFADAFLSCSSVKLYKHRCIWAKNYGRREMGPGAAGTILLFHIISARPSKQPQLVRTFLKVYGAWLLFFLSARTNKRHHHLEALLLQPGAN